MGSRPTEPALHGVTEVYVCVCVCVCVCDWMSFRSEVSQNWAARTALSFLTISAGTAQQPRHENPEPRGDEGSVALELSIS